MNTPQEYIEVAAGVLVDSQGRVLVARRAEHAHQGGLWEFPGGKVHAGEKSLAALRRELAEELGIEPVAARPLIRVRHDYGDKRVLLDCWLVESWRGEPEGLQGQPLQWVDIDSLATLGMPAADRSIVNAVRLPPLCLVTPEPGPDRGAFLTALERSLAGGVRLVVLRARSLDGSDYLELLRAVHDRCRASMARLVANPPEDVDTESLMQIGVDGLHLNAARLRQTGQRPVVDELWLSAACHDAEELAMAEAVGCDFALLSPVCSTLTHPDSTPLGWQRFNELTEAVSLPVYALGGLDRHDCTLAWQAGGQGVAAMRALWAGGE